MVVLRNKTLRCRDRLGDDGFVSAREVVDVKPSLAPGSSRIPRQLVDLQSRITRATSRSELVATLGAVGALVPVRDRVSIVFVEPDGEWMRIYRVVPAAPIGESLPRVRIEGTPVGQVVREGVGRVVADVRADPNITFGHASHDRIRSTLSVPIWVGGAVVGAMNAGSRQPGACDDDMLEQLAEIAGALGPAIYACEQRLRRGDRVDSTPPAPELVGLSARFRSMISLARRASSSDEVVLITGETGVGKTSLARAIHTWSDRAGGPFVTVHIADLSPALVESELFGHVRGAFTGADRDRPGRFERARGGTLFLDEIGETPLALQAKLLRVIQDRRFERVGSSETVEADVRIIAATSRDLPRRIASGEFREDLFYRLNVVPLHVPPLRERRDDLELLARSLLARVAGPGRRLSSAALRRLGDHDWPGNIRELECALRRAVILEDGDELELEGLPSVAGDPVVAAAGVREAWPSLADVQRRYIEKVLRHCDGVIEGKQGAAQLLGLRPSTLRSRMKRLGISARVIRQRGGTR